MRDMPGPTACQPHSLPAPRQQDRFIPRSTIAQRHVGRGMLAATSPAPCPSQGPRTLPLAIVRPPPPSPEPFHKPIDKSLAHLGFI